MIPCWFVRDYLILLRKKGRVIFAEYCSSPVLIGVGIRVIPDDMSTPEDRKTMAVEGQDDKSLQGSKVLVGRVWQVKKAEYSNRDNPIFAGRIRDSGLQAGIIGVLCLT